jgi:hypothetical protein
MAIALLRVEGAFLGRSLAGIAVVAVVHLAAHGRLATVAISRATATAATPAASASFAPRRTVGGRAVASRIRSVVRRTCRRCGGPGSRGTGRCCRRGLLFALTLALAFTLRLAFGLALLVTLAILFAILIPVLFALRIALAMALRVTRTRLAIAVTVTISVAVAVAAAVAMAFLVTTPVRSALAVSIAPAFTVAMRTAIAIPIAMAVLTRRAARVVAGRGRRLGACGALAGE